MLASTGTSTDSSCSVSITRLPEAVNDIISIWKCCVWVVANGNTGNGAAASESNVSLGMNNGRTGSSSQTFALCELMKLKADANILISNLPQTSVAQHIKVHSNNSAGTDNNSAGLVMKSVEMLLKVRSQYPTKQLECYVTILEGLVCNKV